MNEQPRALVIGIASMDIRGRTRDTLVPATPNPGSTVCIAATARLDREL